MGDVIQFKKPGLKVKHKGHTLCKSGFHKWEVIETPFDVKKGKMLTAYRCSRCGKTKTESK
jgi:hypothetical protein